MGADTVVSGRGKSKTCFATLAERKTRYYIAVKIPNRNADTLAKAVIAALSKLPKGAVKSITCDRGRDNVIENQIGVVEYYDPFKEWIDSLAKKSNK